MRRRVILAIVLILSTATAGAVGWAITARIAAPALPSASAFHPGTCRNVAEPVLSLARLAHRVEDRRTVSTPDREELRRVQDTLVSASPGAPAELAEALDVVVRAIGYARLRVDSGTFEPSYLRDVDTARQRLQSACVG